MRFPLERFLPVFAAVLLILSGCRTEELPNLTRDQLFITITAVPATLSVRAPGESRPSSQLTALLRNEQGEGIPGETLLFRITDASGNEIAVGALNTGQAVTDTTGAAKVIYTAPNSSEQPSNRQIFITVRLINPAYPFEVSGSQAINLQLSGPPTQCSIAASPQNPAVGAIVNFIATVPGSGTLVSFEWEFGDTTSATTTTNTVSHQYTLQGTFTVDLIATNTAGDEFTCKTNVQVGGGASGAPQCSFTSNPNPSCVNQSVSFNGSGSDPDGGPVTFSWSFGSTLEDPSNTFVSEGIKNISLTVTDDENQTCTATGKQVVLGAPTISGFSPSAGAVGTTITINGTNLVTGGTLTIGGAPVASFIVNGKGTQMTAQVPTGAVDGTITFNNGCGQVTSATAFDVCGALSITGPGAVGEGNAGSTAFNFTVDTTEACSVGQSADFNTSGCAPNQATADDFSGALTGNVTIPGTQASTNFSIQVAGDTTIEPDECFRVTLSSPTNATIGAPASADATIQNDDL